MIGRCEEISVRSEQRVSTELRCTLMQTVGASPCGCDAGELSVAAAAAAVATICERLRVSATCVENAKGPLCDTYIHRCAARTFNSCALPSTALAAPKWHRVQYKVQHHLVQNPDLLSQCGQNARILACFRTFCRRFGGGWHNAAELPPPPPPPPPPLLLDRSFPTARF